MSGAGSTTDLSMAARPAIRRPTRHLPPPAGWRERLHRARFTLARRALQLTVLLLFYGTLHAGWTLFGAPLLSGNLSASRIAGVLPMADPFAVLQLLAARHALATEVLVGAAVTLAAYGLVGGRLFCAWVCPMNVVTDAAGAVRQRLGLPAGADLLHLPAYTRYAVLAVSLVVSAAGGVAAFEWLSPVAMLHRELLYGIGLGLGGAVGIFLLDAFVMRHGWCGHLCPLGAFWALVGRAGQLKVAFDDARCSRCHDCIKVCPEPRVLHLDQAAARGLVTSGECTGCGRCVAVCPEHCLRFDLRPRCRPAAAPIVFHPGG